MADTPGARRLHPRLRVFRNGSRSVNAVRSDSTTTMACALPALNEKRGVLPAPALTASAPDREALRGLLRIPKTRKLTRRLKIDEQPKAEQAFVNVLVELSSERSDVPLAAQGKQRKTLDKLLERGVSAAKRAALAGAMLPRRTFISATVPVSMLDELKDLPAVSFVHPSDPLKLDAPPASHATEAVNKAIGDAATYGRGGGVLIGIIDVGGFDFAHQDFLDDDGNTRFVSIWDQRTGRRPPPKARGFDYGSEILQAHMNAAIAAAKQPGVPPATLLERQSQTTPGAHGTHVASIAAGKSGVCPEAHIAGVLIDVATSRRSDSAPAHDLQRHEPDHSCRRVPAQSGDRDAGAACRQHQPRHQRRRARRIERRVALARRVSGRARTRHLHRRRKRRAGKGADRGRSRLDRRAGSIRRDASRRAGWRSSSSGRSSATASKI